MGDRLNETEMQSIDETTTLVVGHGFEDSDYESNDDNYQLLKRLKKYARVIRRIFALPNRTHANQLRLIRETTRRFDFQNLINADPQEEEGDIPQLNENAEGEAEEDQIEVLRRENQEIRQQNEELKNQLYGNSLDEALAGLENRKSDDQGWSQLERLYKTEVAEQKDRADSLAQENSELLARLAEMEAEAKLFREGANKRWEELEKQLEASRLRGELAAKKEDVKTQERVLGDLNEQIARLNQKVHSLQAEKEELQKANAQLQERLAVMESQKATLQREHGSLAEQLRSHDAVHSTLRELNQALKQELLNREEALQLKTDQIEQARLKAEDLAERNKGLNELLAKVAADHQRASADHQKREAQAAAHIQALAKQLAEANERQQRSQQQLESERVGVAQELRELRDFRASHQAIMEKYQEEIAQLRSSNRKLKEEADRPIGREKLCSIIKAHFQALSRPSKQEFKRDMGIFIGSFKVE